MSPRLFLAAVGAVLLLGSLADAQFSALTFRPVAAEYSPQLDRIIMVSASPNQLHIYNAATNTDVTVNLAATPTALSVSADGVRAGVAHDHLLSYVDLSQATLVRTYPLSMAADTVVLGDGYAYVASSTTGVLNLATGLESPSIFSAVYGGRYSPTAKAIYTTNTTFAYSTYKKLDISSGPVTAVLTSPFTFPCRRTWLSPDYSRVYTGCGAVLSGDDLRYLSTVAGPVYTEVAALNESATAHRIAAIFNGGYSGWVGPDNEIHVYESGYFRPVAKFVVPDVPVASKSYQVHGKWVFYNSAGSAITAIGQIDTSAGLSTNDFVVYTIPVGNPPPCSAQFTASSATIVSTGSQGSVGITASQDCIYQATSNVPWIEAASGMYASGNGTLNYLVRPNPTHVSRSGAIALGGQTFVVTQDPAPAATAQQTRLAYNVTDAEYSKQLDRIVFVSSAPDELHVYDPITATDQYIVLAAPPLSVSVSPDGLSAVVGHDGWVSLVNLQSVTVAKVIPVPLVVGDVVLAANGYTYLFPKMTGTVCSVQIATGTVTPFVDVNEPLTARLQPPGTYVYALGNAGTRLKFDISNGIPRPVLTTLVAGNDLRTNAAITESGDRLISGSWVFSLSETHSDDLVHVATLSNTVGSTSVTDSVLRQSIAVVPHDALATDLGEQRCNCMETPHSALRAAFRCRG